MEENQQDSQPGPADNDQLTEVPDQVYFSWTANEFIEHKKSFAWYLILFGLLVLVAVGIFFLVHSIFPSVMIVLIGIAFAIIAGRHPRVLNYELNNLGVSIGRRSNSYNEFKSFSVIDENNLGAIVLNPLKRFVFPTSIFYDLKDEENIVKTLMEHLPIEEPADDPIDQLMRRLRF